MGYTGSSEDVFETTAYTKVPPPKRTVDHGVLLPLQLRQRRKQKSVAG